MATPDIAATHAVRNIRRMLVEYGLARGWSQEETDDLLEWLGLDPVGCRSLRPGPRHDPVDVHVYVLGEDYPGSALVKVGVSRSPAQRCRTLEREKERNLYVAHQIGPYTRSAAMRIERLAHFDHSHCALGGEWFSCGVGAAWDSVQTAAGVPDMSAEEDII